MLSREPRTLKETKVLPQHPAHCEALGLAGRTPGEGGGRKGVEGLGQRWERGIGGEDKEGEGEESEGRREKEGKVEE